MKRLIKIILHKKAAHKMLLGLTPVVNFINVLTYIHIFRTNVVFSSYIYVEKMTFVQKKRAKNVGEIDTWTKYVEIRFRVLVVFKRRIVV